METGLRGRSAVVTGGASGIGRSIALALAAEGAHVTIADVDVAQAQATMDQITANGGSAQVIQCDVANEAAVMGAIDHVLASAGRLDIMINNAGIGGTRGSLLQLTADDWDQVYAVNLRGVFLGVKHAARAMIQGGSGGSIVNIASVAGLGGAVRLGPYGATKAGVIQLTQTAALELARNGVRVNAICPGWIETPILGDVERAQLVRQVPLGRIGQPDEVASMVLYLASDAAAFVTGSVVRVDGGMRS